MLLVILSWNLTWACPSIYITGLYFLSAIYLILTDLGNAQSLGTNQQSVNSCRDSVLFTVKSPSTYCQDKHVFIRTTQLNFTASGFFHLLRKKGRLSSVG